ncbi:MAG: glycosyltransferase, exosortase A system-associated [Gammaproteobacteria bacterium]|nr:glycosyltransferase, exosortase A system-associated [Gammaproteobacteria bacterium]MBU0770636.1 glycosyltransferase, exosortase A system-associated [Gammaproteobacteria bacterium]MBU0856208.1 glycosyltransferase, exosortase A system-associated [Gammaproteobacteria bacterium]MBU1845605.1 glycosyltransferase, exosortase A system-associated [Gammaproteobacteria bacterium]
MRILHVLDHSIPLHSGYTFRTAAILREQRKLGWDTHHVTSVKHTEPGPAVEEVDGLVFHRTPWSPGAFDNVPVLRERAQMRALSQRLLEVARKVKPDVLHAHSPVLNAFPALKVGRELGIPVVYEIRAFWEDAAVDHGTTTEGSLRYRATRAMETRAVHQVDAVTTICEGLRADLLGRGVAPGKITVIPNAVDIDNFAFGVAGDEALRAELGFAGKRVLGFIGSFYAYEGLDLLLRALPSILQKAPDVALLLTGGGPQDANLRQLVQELGLQASVKFTGRVPHADVQRYYNLVDVLAYPRHSMRLTDLVTPLKPLEAMAQGRLLVASDVGGHRELIRDGETGMLFRAGDVDDLARSVLQLLDMQERWPALRAAGRRFVERERNWTASVARYRDVYGALTGKVAA